MKKNTTKSRRYTFTINNYTQKDLKFFHELAKSLAQHRYICYGLETAPTTGTKHIQGYIELNSAQRFTYLHNYLNFKRNGKLLKFHIDISNGTAEENKKYAEKDGDFYEFGEPITQGVRTDLLEIKLMVKENPKDINKIIDEHGNNLQQIRFAQILQPVYLSNRNPANPPKVYWIFGSSGVGKTRLVFETFDDICSVSSYKWLGTGYNQNECFLFDDFREENLPFETVLKITDRYPYVLEFKGSQIPLNSPFIIFTSPKSIDSTFQFTREDLTQIKRRVVEINLDAIDNINDIDLRNIDTQPFSTLEDDCNSF